MSDESMRPANRNGGSRSGMNGKVLAIVLACVLVVTLIGLDVARAHACGVWRDKVAATEAYWLRIGMPAIGVTQAQAENPRPWYC